MTTCEITDIETTKLLVIGATAGVVLAVAVQFITVYFAMYIYTQVKSLETNTIYTYNTIPDTNTNTNIHNTELIPAKKIYTMKYDNEGMLIHE